MQREKEEKLAAEKRAKEVLKRREEARKKAEEKLNQKSKNKPVKKNNKKKDHASQWPWSSFHFDGEVDCRSSFRIRIIVSFQHVCVKLAVNVWESITLKR